LPKAKETDAIVIDEMVIATATVAMVSTGAVAVGVELRAIYSATSVASEDILRETVALDATIAEVVIVIVVVVAGIEEIVVIAVAEEIAPGIGVAVIARGIGVAVAIVIDPGIGVEIVRVIVVLHAIRAKNERVIANGVIGIDPKEKNVIEAEQDHKAVIRVQVLLPQQQKTANQGQDRPASIEISERRVFIQIMAAKKMVLPTSKYTTRTEMEASTETLQWNET
jgi:hypothetical protein